MDKTESLVQRTEQARKERTEIIVLDQFTNNGRKYRQPLTSVFTYELSTLQGARVIHIQ